jgi:hypothetical protein
MSLLVGFDEIAGSTTYGQILISPGVSDITSLHEWYGVEVIDSAGVTIKAVPAAFLNIAPTSAPIIFDSNNATPSNGLNQPILPIAILSDVTGQFRRGSYEIRVYTISEITTGVFQRTKLQGVFKFCLITLNPIVTVFSSCANRMLKAIDGTNYLGLSYIMRDFSITCITPVINHVFPRAATTNNDIQLALTHSNVTYDVKLNIKAQKVITNTSSVFTQYVSLNFATQYTIKCNDNVCDLIKCANTKLKEFEEKLSKNGQLSTANQSKKQRITELVALIGASTECEDLFNESIESLKNIIGDCGCGCGEDNTPRPFSNQSLISSTITNVQTAIGGQFVYFFDVSSGGFDFLINPALLLPNVHYTLRILHGSTGNQLTVKTILPAQIGLLHNTTFQSFIKLNEQASFTFAISSSINSDVYQICSI